MPSIPHYMLPTASSLARSHPTTAATVSSSRPLRARQDPAAARAARAARAAAAADYLKNEISLEFAEAREELCHDLRMDCEYYAEHGPFSFDRDASERLDVSAISDDQLD